MFNIKVEI